MAKPSFPTFRFACLLAAFVFSGLLISHYSGSSKPKSFALAGAPAAAKPIRLAAPLSAAQRAALVKQQAALAKRNAEAQLYAEKKQIAIYIAAIGVKELHDHARDPDSFKLSEALIVPSGAACLEFRAQNGFGGMNVERAVVTPKGRMFTQEGDAFAPLWNKECAGKTGDDETERISIMARLD